MTTAQKVSEQQKIANDKIDKIAEQYVTEEIIELIERSSTYNKIIKSKDPEEFMDLTLIQWDTCTASVFCKLRRKFKEQKVSASQSLLIRICKLAARKIRKRHKLIMGIESKST